MARQRNRILSQTPNAVRKRINYDKKLEQEAEKKRRSAAGTKAAETKKANLSSLRITGIKEIGKMFHTATHGVVKLGSEQSADSKPSASSAVPSGSSMASYPTAGSSSASLPTSVGVPSGSSTASYPSDAYYAAATRRDDESLEDFLLFETPQQSEDPPPQYGTYRHYVTPPPQRYAVAASLPTYASMASRPAAASYPLMQQDAVVNYRGTEPDCSSLKRNAAVLSNYESVADSPIPKKQRPLAATSILDSLPPPHLSIATITLGKQGNEYNLSNVVIGTHASGRLRVRGGMMDKKDAMQKMALGTVARKRSPEHTGYMLTFLDDNGVKHEFHLELNNREQVVRLKTYTAKSPLRLNDKNGRRKMMLDQLGWLSHVIDVPLPLLGNYLARAILNFDFTMLSCPGLPTVMDVIHSILPTQEEIVLLQNIPYAGEMGDPENWILAIAEIATFPQRVEIMRQAVWNMHELDMQELEVPNIFD